MKRQKTKTQVTYASTAGSNLSDTEAKIIGEVLYSISERDGCVKASTLVTESVPKDAPLHNRFTWDDKVAGGNYRLIEARNIIRSVRVIEEDIPIAEQPTIRAFVSVEASDTETRFSGRGYIPMSRVIESDDYKKQVLNRAKAELREWQARYRDYSDYFAGVFREVDSLK